MGLESIFNIAGQGLAAQSVRLNTTASNIANADTATSTKETAYKAKNAVFATIKASFEEGDSPTQFGVKVMGVKESKAEAIMKYAPEHPQANEQGYVFMPNVNVVEEMANMISASRTYQTNAQMMNTVKGLLQQTLNIGR